MSRFPLVLVLGGARSGKSTFALARARSFGRSLVYLATAEAGDDEMAARIARHRAERGEEWRTIEERLAIAPILRAEQGKTIVVDCLTIWLANLMGDEVEATARIDGALADLLSALAERQSAIIAVSNEVGLGIVPDHPLGRAFRDAAGLMNQKVAEVAGEVYLLVAGQPLRVK